MQILSGGFTCCESAGRGPEPGDSSGSDIGCESVRTGSIDMDTLTGFTGFESSGRVVVPEDTSGLD